MYNPDEDYQVMLAKLKTICQNKNYTICFGKGHRDVNFQYKLPNEGRNETIYLYSTDNL